MKRHIAQRGAVTLIAVLALTACGSGGSTAEEAEDDAAVEAGSEDQALEETASSDAEPSAIAEPTEADLDETVAPSTDAASATDTPVALDGVVDTTVGVLAAQWASNVDITMSEGSFTFESDSLPSHELPDQFLIPQGAPGDVDAEFVATDTASLLSPAAISVEIALQPVYSDVVTENPLGQIGVLSSGAQLFNDFENMERSIVAIEDQTVIDGVVITNDGLDECSGHVGPTPEFPEGIYHYHLTDDAAPYSINCYHGVVDDSVAAGGGGGAPGGDGEGQGPPDGAGPPDGQGPPDRAAPPEGDA